MKKKKVKKFSLVKAVKKAARDNSKGLKLVTKPHSEDGYDRKIEKKKSAKVIDEEIKDTKE